MKGPGIMGSATRAHGGMRHLVGFGLAILAMLMVGLIQPVGARADLARCDSFETQPEAQAVLDQNPEFESNLDPDGNGIACEELPAVDPSPTDDFTSCEQFETQVDAQRELNKRTDDSLERRFALDADGNGVACEDTFDVNDGERPEDIRTCDDFANQEEAQAYFDFEATDLQGSVLDPDGDFLACEDAYDAPTVVVCAEETGTLIEVSESEQNDLDFQSHRATEAEIATGECEATVPVTPGADGEPDEGVVVVCNLAFGTLVEVRDSEGVLEGLDFPSRPATQAEIAAGECAATAPVTPDGEGEPDEEEDTDSDNTNIVALPATGAGTGTSMEQAQQESLLAVLLVLTGSALALRSRIRRTQA